MPKLRFEDSDNQYTLEADTPLQPSCEEEGIPFACREGVCGTCVIEVVEGNAHLTDYTEAEEDFFGPEGEQPVERLACQCRMKGSGDVTARY